MDSRNLMTFLRVAELKSFTKAAEDLGYAQSTVTTQVQQLEHEIGVPLFDRINKKISLTQAGEEMVKYAYVMLKLEAEIYKINGNKTEPTGALRIGVPESLLTTFLYQCIAEYRKQYSKITLEIETNSSAELVQRIRQNNIDIALLFGGRLIESDLFAACSFQEDLVFVTHPNNDLCNRKNITIADIAQQPLILPERSSIYRHALENAVSQGNYNFNPIIQINHTSTIVKFLFDGLGISFLPHYLIRPYLASKQLVVLEVKDFKIPPYYIHLLYHKEKWVTPQMEGFIKTIKDKYPTK